MPARKRAFLFINSNCRQLAPLDGADVNNLLLDAVAWEACTVGRFETSKALKDFKWNLVFLALAL
jgi:hypothetical protein